MMYQEETDHKRLFLAVFLAAALLIGWQIAVELPRRQQLAAYHSEQAKKLAEDQARAAAAMPVREAAEENQALSREERLAAGGRITIRSDKLHGSIALKGARIDDLTLAGYRETLAPESKEVVLLSPQGDAQAYFMQAGWLAADNKTKVPTADTVWRADRQDLKPEHPVTLSWDNGEGQNYFITIALDKDYMFTVTQRMENKAAQPVAVAPYAFINRAYEDSGAMHYGILHEGPLGVLAGALEEISYEALRDKGNKVFDQAGGWLGVTDKYWLTALVPEGAFKATFSHYEKGGRHRYQTDYLGAPVTVAAGGGADQRLRFFAGAKEIRVLDRYAEGNAAAAAPPIPLFDRAVDFGVLYFLTKPLFLLLTFFFEHLGNFGIAILLLTIVVKLLMYPLANKSYHSMAQMRELQPELLKLRERHKGDQMKINQEMMALYKREKVNPASGCLPILIQLPVFFALYKVLFVTIEMRHAPFFGWLKDLSAADPSNVFTLFGLLNWGPPAWLHLGILPILFCASMVVQMKQQPKPADPIQAKMIAWMPYIFLFICAGFPAGLVLYWTWSNILSIAQQQLIITQHKKLMAKRSRNKPAA